MLQGGNLSQAMIHDWIFIFAIHALFTAAIAAVLYRRLRKKLEAQHWQGTLLQQQHNVLAQTLDACQKLQGFLASENRPFHIIINTLPKVGSISMVATIRRAVPDAVVEHIHGVSVTRQRMLADQTEQAARDGLESLKQSLLAEFWRTTRLWHLLERHRMERLGCKGMFFICGVREPIAWALSYLFHFHHAGLLPDEVLCAGSLKPLMMKWLTGAHNQLDETSPGEASLKAANVTPPAQVASYEPPDKWLERELHDCLGVNPTEAGFDHSLGYQVYESSYGLVLVIRQESLECLPAALSKLLGAPQSAFEITPSHVSEDKTHGDIYRNLRQTLRFPVRFLEELYARPYASTYYSAEERKTFVERWRE